jgi:hypothetical protein
MASGCGKSTVVRDERVASERRIERLLGLRPPFEVQAATFLDDCGTGCMSVFTARDTLALYADNRCFAIPETWTHLPPDSFDLKVRTVERHLWLYDYPDSPKARELEFNSPAESAAIDLVRLAIATSFTPGEESLLVRGEPAAPLRGLKEIRQFLARIEFRRQDAADMAKLNGSR